MKVIDLQKVSRETDLRCSEHFLLSEFLRTDTGFVNDDIDSSIYSNLCLLCHLVLEPMRLYIGDIPLSVTSGYRSAAVNAAVGGVPNSYHRFGLAVDVSAAVGVDDMIEFLYIQKDNLYARGLDLRFVHYVDRYFIHVQLSSL